MGQTSAQLEGMSIAGKRGGPGQVLEREIEKENITN
jgi:hypothetical protein